MRLKLTLIAALAVATGFAIPVAVSVSTAQATTVDPTVMNFSGPCSGDVPLGTTTTCTAFVFDTVVNGGTTPTGTLTFTSDTSGGTFPGGATCTLTPAIDDGPTAFCSVSYTSGLTSPGTETITASYSGDSGHAVSSAQAVMTVTVRPTALSLTCSPATVAIGQATSCTATVGDTAGSASTPTGTVSFTAGTHKGNFTGVGSCTLAAIGAAQASCSVSFSAPPQLPLGTQTITASYGGDSGHAVSGNDVFITVTFRATSTSLSCQEVPPVVQSHCTATVSDISLGPAAAPIGTIIFTSSGPGHFIGAAECTLSASGTSASCTVTYTTPEGVPFAGQIITAIYEPGDSSHLPSTGSTVLN